MDLNEGTNACGWVSQHLEAHLEGELSGAESGRLTAHIAGCAACRAEERLARRLSAELAELPPLEGPDAMIETVLERARTQEQARRRALWGRRLRGWLQPAWKPSLALAACLALFFAVQPPPPAAGPTAAEIAQAERQARLALAYIGRASRRAGLAVQQQVIADGIVAPVQRQARAALDPEQTM